MTSLPMISIVTPSYNQGRFIEATLRSVLNQGYPHLEYIVIDGSSTDGSVETIHKYGAQMHFWESETDHGQGHAINKGFSHATGEIMGWINSDDVLLPNALTTIGRIFAQYPQIAWVTGVGVSINTQGDVISVTHPFGYQRSWISRGWYHGRFLGFIRQESTLWRRSLWEKAGGQVNETLSFGLDFDLWRRFARHADLVLVQSKLAAYRIHDKQKTQQLEHYYGEIGVHTPAFIRAATLPMRAMLKATASSFFPQVSYDAKSQGWKFYPGRFFNASIC